MIHPQADPARPTSRPQTPDWRRRLPVLRGRRVVLREIRLADVDPLMAALADPEVTRHITPPPATREQFERFVRWARAGRRAGRFVCFVPVSRASGCPAGVIEVWPIDSGFDVAEWGFVIGRAWWGTGLFHEAAELVLEFVFGTLGTARLEARSAVANGRGNEALRKLGAVEEGLLRRCFALRGERRDHVMWSILADEWWGRRSARRDVH